MKEHLLKIKKQLDEDKKLKDIITKYAGNVTEGHVKNGVYYENNTPIGILARKVKCFKKLGLSYSYYNLNVNGEGLKKITPSNEDWTEYPFDEDCYFIYLAWDDSIFNYVETYD